MDVEAPPHAAMNAAGSGGTNTKKEYIRCKAICFLFLYGVVYFIGVVILFVIFLIVYFVTMSVTHVDIGVWLVLWFLLTQAWGVALAWLTDMWTAQRQARAAQPVAPKPAADQARPTPGQLNKRFASWVEYSSESAHAVLFSSLGMWLSPHFPTIPYVPLCSSWSVRYSHFVLFTFLLRSSADFSICSSGRGAFIVRGTAVCSPGATICRLCSDGGSGNPEKLSFCWHGGGRGTMSRI